MAIEEIHGFAHYHFDLEWWKTEANYAKDMVEIIEHAARMLREYPEFKYVLDQATSIEPYLEAHPDKIDELKSWIAEGRVEVVGGTLAAPDHNIPTGEALVRQQVMGMAWAEQVLGAEVVSGWAIDTFGHPSQIPQIYSKCGLESITFARGITPWYREHPLDFMWQGPDGSAVQVHWLAAHYNQFMPLGRKANRLIRGLFQELKQRIAYEAPRTMAKVLMVPVGADFCIPVPDWILFVKSWNLQHDLPFKFAIPRESLRQIRESCKGRMPQASGEFNPLFSGGYESRHKLKRLCRKTEHDLLSAERLAALSWALGNEYPEQDLCEAWTGVLKCDFHDTINGTGTDAVTREALARYSQAEALIEKVVQDSSRLLSDQVKPGSRSLQAINTLAWPRTEVLRMKSAQLGDNIPYDSTGKPLPCQRVADEIIIPVELPALGRQTIYLKPGKIYRDNGPFDEDQSYITTPFYEVGKQNGRWRSIMDRSSNRHVLHESRVGIFEPIVEEDVGNLWTVQLTGERERAISKDDWHLISTGAVARVYERHFTFPSAKVKLKVWFYADIRRIDLDVDLNFSGRDRRIRIACPLGFGGSINMESPYGVEKRAPGHWCAQTWADVAGRDFGVAVLNRGNPGYTMGVDRMDVTLLRSVSVLPLRGLLRFISRNRAKILSSLLRAYKMARRGLFTLTEWELYKFHGLLLREWATEGPKVNKPGGMPFAADHIGSYLKGNQEALCWERGEHSFSYGVLAHAGDFSDASLSRRGMEFNTRVILHTLEGIPKNPERSLVGIEPENALLSVIKRSEDREALVLRVVETAGRKADVVINLPCPARSAAKVLMTEKQQIGKADVQAKQVRATLAPFEIATIRVEL